jgi:hypothetical protein
VDCIMQSLKNSSIRSMKPYALFHLKKSWAGMFIWHPLKSINILGSILLMLILEVDIIQENILGIIQIVLILEVSISKKLTKNDCNL